MLVVGYLLLKINHQLLIYLIRQNIGLKMTAIYKTVPNFVKATKIPSKDSKISLPFNIRLLGYIGQSVSAHAYVEQLRTFGLIGSYFGWRSWAPCVALAVFISAQRNLFSFFSMGHIFRLAHRKRRFC